MKRFYLLLLFLSAFVGFCAVATAYDDWDKKPEPEVEIPKDTPPDDRTVDELIGELKAAKYARDRAEIMDECKKRKAEDLPKFLALFGEKDYRMRKAAVELMMHFRSPDACERLIKLYASDPDRPVREISRDFMTYFPQQCAPIFVKNLVSEDKQFKDEYRADAKVMVERYGPGAGAAVADAFKGDNAELKKIIQNMMDERFPAAVQNLKGIYMDRRGRRWLETKATPQDIMKFLYMPYLGVFGSVGMPEFINYYKDPKRDLSEKTFHALFFSYLKTPELIGVLRETTADKTKEIQLASLIGLSRLVDPANEKVFREALKDDDFEVVEEALFALVNIEIDKNKTYAELSDVFQNEKTTPPNVGAIAVVIARQGLVRLKRGERPELNKNMPLLVAKINHKETPVRVGVAQGLGYYHKNEEAAKLLVEKLTDDKQPMTVRTASAVSLGQIQLGMAVDPLLNQLTTEDVGFLCACLEALGSISDLKAHAQVLSFLKHKNPVVALSAMKGLGQLFPDWSGATGVAEKGDTYHVLNFIKHDNINLRKQAMYTSFAIAMRYNVAVFDPDGNFLATPPSDEALEEQKDAVYEMFLDWWEEEKDAQGETKKVEKKEEKKEEKKVEEEKEFDPAKEIGKEPVKVDELKPKKKK